MQKREYKTGMELTAKQWKILEPLFPEPIQSSKGGPNWARLEGILWGLRTGTRWRDMPDAILREALAGIDYRNGRRGTFWLTFGKNYSEH